MDLMRPPSPLGNVLHVLFTGEGSLGRAFTYVKHSYFFSIMFASFHHKDTLKVSHILLYL